MLSPTTIDQGLTLAERLALERGVAAASVVSVEQMRQIEAAAVAAGIPERELQRSAARSIADLASALGPPDQRELVVTLVGPGNNGRDAMLAAGHLARRGYRTALFLGPRHAVEAQELVELRRQGIPLLAYSENGADSLQRLGHWLERAWLAIDGLLGIGARGALRPPLSDVASLLNEVRAQAGGSLQVLAVDIPSGIDADLGQVEGTAVCADVTAALGAVKAGTLRFPAAAYAGAIVPLSIDLPAELAPSDTPRLLDRSLLAALLPTRDPAGHKGTFGKVLIVGGSTSYLGAPLLAAVAAARSGCGLVALAVPPQVQAAAAPLLPEATCAARITPDADPEGALDLVVDRLAAFDALLLGPGLGRGPQIEQFVRGLLQALARAGGPPAVVDADALNVLAAWDGWWQTVDSPLVLTPHHVEMSRLTGEPPEAIARDNWEATRRFADRWRQVVVLKGAHTSVAVPGRGAVVLPAANAALATAGSGDVLAGLLAGLLAQRLQPWDAARLAVYVHAWAARVLVEREQRRSLLASDLPAEFPRLLRLLDRHWRWPARWDQTIRSPGSHERR